MDIEDWREKFKAAANNYYASIEAGNPRGANKANDRAIALYAELKGYGEGWENELEKMIDNIDGAIRYMAAVHLLKCVPEKGLRVLRTISDGPPSPLRLLARTSLMHWNQTMHNSDR